MNSGLRDATNLAWKLAAVGASVAGDDLVATYDVERRPHATEMVGFATRMGAMYRPRNVVTERLRDAVFRAVQVVPGGRDYILQMKYKPMPRYTDGVVVGVDRSSRTDPVGRMFPQPDVDAPGGRGASTTPSGRGSPCSPSSTTRPRSTRPASRGGARWVPASSTSCARGPMSTVRRVPWVTPATC